MFDRISFHKNLRKSTAFSLLLVMLSWNEVYAADSAPTSLDNKTTLLHSSPVDASSTVVVKGFLVTGNTIIAGNELQTLLVNYIDQRCDLQKLREASSRVTEEYRRRGNMLAKAYILPQTITDGMVKITVVEGRIGNIVIEGNRNYSSQFIRNYLTSGDSQERLAIDRLERGILLLDSRFIDLKVKANFSPGVAPGTTDIHVKVEDCAPLHATISTNNLGSEFVSRYRFGGQFEWTNLAIQGSTFTFGGFIGDKLSRMHVVNGGYLFPLNSVGTIIGVNVLDGNFEVGKDFADLGIHNREIGGELFISHPFLYNRKSTLIGKTGFKASDAKYYLLDALSARDNIRSVYAELQWDHFSLGGRTLAGLTVSQGLGHVLGGTPNGDQLSSRINASNEFTHVKGNFARLQPLSSRFSTLLRLSGQWSGASLPAGEEWLVGGFNSVHGYSFGEASGDCGYSASVALRLSPFPDKEILKFSAFLDHGYARKRTPLSGSNGNKDLTGFGLGINSHLGTFAPTDVRLDIGWPLNPSTNFLHESPVIYFDTSIRF
ncbi:MAG: ShlB/FhaC/HecB family hemolysin secretion/activation protein [Chlorobium sp.]|nr:MAG: ShlB/FhaC/HecB family hemolysin secretion/activation protein [Chlorobium sp.]